MLRSKELVAFLALAILVGCEGTPPGTPQEIVKSGTKSEHALLTQPYWEAARCMARNTTKLGAEYHGMARPLIPESGDNSVEAMEAHEMIVMRGLGANPSSVAVAHVGMRKGKTHASIWTASRTSREKFVQTLVGDC